MHDVYISYARGDENAAKVISDRLSSEGRSVFFDRVALVEGESFSDRIISEIRSAKVVLALLSSKSRKDKWVANDLQAVLDTKKLIIPVLLDKDAKENWLWPLLGNRQSLELDLTSPIWRSQLDELVRAISVTVAPPTASVTVAPPTATMSTELAPAPSRAHRWGLIVLAAAVGALVMYVLMLLISR